MATFWERVTGFGDGANDLLDLEVLQTAVILFSCFGIISLQEVKNLVGLTNEQGDELHEFIVAAQPGGTQERMLWTVGVRSILIAARAGVTALNTIENVWAALNFLPSSDE